MRSAGFQNLQILGYTLCTFAQITTFSAAKYDTLAERAAANTTILPAPIVASVSQYWEGNDGPWSTFAIRIGQRPQNIRVLPSTSASFTYVVQDLGCPDDSPTNCQDSRGGIFNPNMSLTWVPNSIYSLGLSENLDVKVFGDFGFDTLTLGWHGSGGPSINHSIVASIGDTHFSWLGGFGLNPRPTNFSSFSDSPQVSYLQALVNEKMIPSLSWSYSAGAPYRLDKVFGTLVLGGMDEARFTVPESTSNELTFPFYEDVARDLQVGLSSILTSASLSSSSSSTLSSEGIYALIDSTVPHLILPETVCDAFESAFGLTWNSTTGLYLLNSTQYDVLKKLNPAVTLTLTPSLSEANGNLKSQVDIVLPYSAFDLTISWPHATEPTRYFPLKRATNDTQYTLGRVFLQEAYVIADYERGNFSVWPCKWDTSTKQAAIRAIPSVNSTLSTNTTKLLPDDKPTGKRSLSRGAIVGIAVGAVVGVLAILGIIFVYRHRKLRKAPTVPGLAAQQMPLEPYGLGLRHELPDSPHMFQETEMRAECKASEIDGREHRAELSCQYGEEKTRVLLGVFPGDRQLFELDAAMPGLDNGVSEIDTSPNTPGPNDVMPHP